MSSISHWSTNQTKAYMQCRKCECFFVICSDILYVLEAEIATLVEEEIYPCLVESTNQ
jgi:hypothetical protein